MGSEMCIRDSYYNAHKAEFKLDRPLVKGRIVRFPVNHRQSFKLRELVKASSADRLQDLADICAKNDFELKEFAEWTPWSDFAANLPLRQGMASEQLIRPGEVQHLRDNEKIPKDERTAKDDDALVSLQLENEMLQRGCEFLPIELGRSYASKYVVEDGKVRLPFTAIRGLGDAAAVALEQATMHGQEYISVEELQQASGVAQSVFDKLRAVGALGSLPETSQVDLFSMI